MNRYPLNLGTIRANNGTISECGCQGGTVYRVSELETDNDHVRPRLLFKLNGGSNTTATYSKILQVYGDYVFDNRI